MADGKETVAEDSMPTAEGAQDVDTKALYDFSHLPETVWVKVFEYLSLADKYHVSTTCNNLYHVFNHPSNWKSAQLVAIGGNHNYTLTYTFITDKFKIIVDKFGHFFQRLTICFSGHLVRMQDDFRDLLVHMSEVCRLEHLVLEVGLMTSDFHLEGYCPLHNDLQSILTLVNTAFRLKKVEILSWPMFPEVFNTPTSNVFEVMKQNPKLKSLQSLSLFWMKNKQWVERSPLLPTPAYTLSLISHFHALQHLAVRSPMLSDSLIQELASASREKLLTLKVLVSYVAHDPKHSLPYISSSSWAALVRKSPELAVEMTVMARIPDVDMAAILSPEIPLTEFTVLKFARCSEALIHSLSEKFKNTLQSFICYNDPTDCSKELMRLAEKCRKLHSLVFHGKAHFSHVMEAVRQHRSWKHLEFVGTNIVTDRAGEEFDEDTVVGRGAGGDLVLVGVLRFHGQESEDNREEKLAALKAEVSRRVGYSWTPSSSA